MMIAPVIFALLLGAFIFVILPHAGVARRALSVGIFVMLIAVVYIGASELLGRPKPLALEWRDVAKAQVLSAVPVENEAIYVWLTMPGSPEPRAYVLPWSQSAAQQLQDAMGKAEADGTAVEMAMPSDGGLDDARTDVLRAAATAAAGKGLSGRRLAWSIRGLARQLTRCLIQALMVRCFP